MTKIKNSQNQLSEDQIIDQVIDIINLMGNNKLAEIDLEIPDMKLSLKKHSTVQVQTVQPSMIQMPISSASTEQSKPVTINKPSVVEEKNNFQSILSPMAGTFYRSPSPNSEPFIKEGDQVKTGQTVCIVEAMKMMNEIKSDKPGKVAKIMIENGKAVEKGSCLIQIEA